MSLRERVYSVLIVSASSAFNNSACEMLPPAQYAPVVTVRSVSEAKRCVIDTEFDFVIVNSPLPDDSGIQFSIDRCRSQESVVLVLARTEVHDEIHDRVAEYGVFTLAKPTSRSVMLQALSWMASAREQLRKMEQKTSSIEDKMDEIRVVNRAKCMLISERRMSEPEAHHYIEKFAMDNCIPKKAAAENIMSLFSQSGTKS